VIRAIVSDFGGVLTNPLSEPFGVWYARSGVTLKQLGTAMARAAEHAGGEHPLFALEKGHISEEEFVARLEAHLEGVTFTGFRETYFEHLHPNEPMIEYLRSLRERGYRMAMLTNNVREWEPLWRSKLPVDEIFEVVVDSGFVGMRKPEREIYELTLERLGGGIGFADCLFVDDLDVNCDAARELGMTVVRFDDAEQAIAEIEDALRREGEPGNR
jgi:putative hydrolase of the HAD superfamily